ncbi:MAG: hypothetical protein OK439_03380 [Thaumarchaeota archaeon]|nr:hypothetical protein [Nitrososphaerota archaeon]
MSSGPLPILLSLALFVAAVLSAEIASYGMYLALSLIVLGGFAMIISGIRKEQGSKKEAVLEPELETF